MREIRFRAWDGTRYYYFANHAYTLDYNDISGWNVRPNVPNYETGPWTTGESSATAEMFDLQQFTGCKDKNKADGYEGDIVKMFGRSLFVIRWDEYYARFQLELVEGNEARKVWDMGMLGTSEIVGDIYKNPELVEVKQ